MISFSKCLPLIKKILFKVPQKFAISHFVVLAYGMIFAKSYAQPEADIGTDLSAEMGKNC